VVSETAVVLYKCTDFYHPQAEGGVLWNDPELAITWPVRATPVLSPKDARYPLLREIPAEQLPRYERKKGGAES
jgi:dTDP-4-dehydrorhamnose 3,5-epimerase